MSQEPMPLSHFALSPELDAVVQSSDIAYELISESFGISIDGIEQIVEQLQQTMPKLTITNGHILAFLLRELVDKTILDTVSRNAALSSVKEGDVAQTMQQKIDQIARTYYTGSIWDLLESLAFCLRMVEIAYMNHLKKQSPRSQREFFQQIVKAVRPACKLSAVGYPEAVQMIFRRFAELGVTAEQALNLTLEDDRSSLSPFTTEHSLLESGNEK
jgi:hypothetical protein